jgi:hypothetical protein
MSSRSLWLEGMAMYTRENEKIPSSEGTRRDQSNGGTIWLKDGPLELSTEQILLAIRKSPKTYLDAPKRSRTASHLELLQESTGIIYKRSYDWIQLYWKSRITVMEKDVRLNVGVAGYHMRIDFLRLLHRNLKKRLLP